MLADPRENVSQNLSFLSLLVSRVIGTRTVKKGPGNLGNVNKQVACAGWHALWIKGVTPDQWHALMVGPAKSELVELQLPSIPNHYN